MEFCIDFSDIDCCRHTFPCLSDKVNNFLKQVVYFLIVCDDIDDIKQKRADILENYKEKLKDLVLFQELNQYASKNYSYFPVVFKNEEQLLKVQKALNMNSIFPRRYFYPSLDTLKYIEPKQECKISRKLSKKILCLPIFVELDNCSQEKIIDIIKDNL